MPTAIFSPPNFGAQSTPAPHGDFYLDEQIVSDAELAPKDIPKLTFSGIGIYHHILFKDLIPGQSAKLAPLLRKAMADNRVSGENYRGSWHDVGSPERLAELNKSESL